MTGEKIKHDGDTMKLDRGPGEGGQGERSFIHSKRYGQDNVPGLRDMF